MILLSAAVIFVGLFAMPSTLSLFAGQHTFDTGANVSCKKCHQDVYEEMSCPANDVHWKRTAITPDKQFQCIECHNVTNVSTNFITNTKESSGAHAATTVPCLACHSGSAGGSYETNPMHVLAGKYTIYKLPGGDCGQCHRNAADPKKYPDAFIININASLTNSSEAHSAYYNESINNATFLKAANAACIGCHTHINVKGTWRRSTGYDMVVNETADGNYSITFTVNSSVNTTTTFGGNITANP